MKYFLAFLAAIGLIILIVIMLLSGGGNKVPTTKKALTSYTGPDTQVRMTITGPVNAPQIHNQVQITVAEDQTTYQQLVGYDGQTVNQQVFPNTASSYAVFLHALEHAGFTSGNLDKALKDERGYCPTGTGYIFELMQNGDDIQRFWATSCGKPKTYLGNLSLTTTLFQAQVPGYNTLTQNITL